MVDVREQYEAYPYPERNPKDEKSRLITGSPSHPLEMDHYLWGGARDWSKPLRALVAGGGTGDGLVQLAATLKATNRPCEITYIDLSRASRKVAEARAKARGLTNIEFRTGDLLEVGALGQFDYIDCCGVLHHLAEPIEGFRALSSALADDGGLGFMVYAPYGRSGVYLLQSAFGTLFGDLDPSKRLKAAKQVVRALPEGHPFRRNLQLIDHGSSDAGFYDLLLHSQDQAFTVERLCRTLKDADLNLVSFVEPGRYDLSRFYAASAELNSVEAMAVAEKLDGTMKTHIGYAARSERQVEPASGGMAAVPNLKGVPPGSLAKVVASKGRVQIRSGSEKVSVDIPKTAAPIIARINGRSTLGEIAVTARLDPIAFSAAWKPAERALAGWGLLWYSRLHLNG